MKSILISLLMVFAVIGLNVGTVAAQGINTDDKNKACSAFNANNTCATGTGNDSTTFTGIWANVVNLVTFAVGLVSVLMIVVGGLRYVLSNGEPQGTASAKNTIIYAIVGLIVAIAARSIIFFVIDRVG